MSEQVGRGDCYICGRGHSDILERHHIVPRRFGGSDGADNLVDLCPSCHRSLEKLYGKRFYDTLGVSSESDTVQKVSGLCEFDNCQADAEHLIGGANAEMQCCDDHKVCGLKSCERRSVSAVEMNGGLILACDEHRQCNENGCKSKDSKIHRAPLGFGHTHKAFCDAHGETATILGDPFERRW